MSFNYAELEETAEQLPEPIVLEKGTQVDVRITFVRVGVSEKNGMTYVAPTFEVIDQEDELINDFSGFLWEPGSVQEARNSEQMTLKEYSRNIKTFVNFCKCFDVPMGDDIDLEKDLLGLTGTVIVGIKTSEEYGTQNTVSKYLVD